MTELSNENAEFILGLIAGEGCFSVQLSQRDDLTHGVEIRPSFTVHMKEDGEILETVKDIVGLGEVYAREKGAAWHMTRHGELVELIELIDDHAGSLFWETDKGSVFTNWKQIIERKGSGRHLSEEETKKIIRLAKTLNERGKSGKSVDYWINIVNEGS